MVSTISHLLERYVEREWTRIKFMFCVVFFALFAIARNITYQLHTKLYTIPEVLDGFSLENNMSKMFLFRYPLVVSSARPFSVRDRKSVNYIACNFPFQNILKCWYDTIRERERQRESDKPLKKENYEMNTKRSHNSKWNCSARIEWWISHMEMHVLESDTGTRQRVNIKHT